MEKTKDPYMPCMLKCNMFSQLMTDSISFRLEKQRKKLHKEYLLKDLKDEKEEKLEKV